MTYSLICNRSLAVIIHANLKRHLKLNNLSLSFLKLFNIAQIFNNHLSTFHSAQYKQIGKLFHTWHTKTSLFKSLLTIAHYSLRLAYENGQLLTQTYKFRSQNLLTSVFSFEQFWRKFNHGINKFEKKYTYERLILFGSTSWEVNSTEKSIDLFWLGCFCFWW